METPEVDWNHIKRRYSFVFLELGTAVRGIDRLFRGKPIKSLTYPDDFKFKYIFNVVKRPTINEATLEYVMSGLMPLKVAEQEFKDQANDYKKISVYLSNIEDLSVSISVRGSERILFTRNVNTELTVDNCPKPIIMFLWNISTGEFPSSKLQYKNLPDNRLDEIMVVKEANPYETESYLSEGYVKKMPYLIMHRKRSTVMEYSRFADLDY